MFSTQTYIQRRNILCSLLDEGLVLLMGNNESPMNYADNTYPFRQDSSFLYYIGLDQAGLMALIDINEGQTILFGKDASIDDIVWMGPQENLAVKALKSGITKSLDISKLYEILSKAKSQGRTIHFLPLYRADNKIWLSRALGIQIEQLAERASLGLIKAVVQQREIKSEEEISEIEKAVDTSIDMHVAAIKTARPGMCEAEVAAEVHRIALAQGGNISFPIIATINGQTLHNHYHGNLLKEGDLFLLDAGAETVRHYSGDLSSTFPVSKTFSPIQKIVYEASLKAHYAAVNSLGPGKSYRDVHRSACLSIIDSMQALGLMKGDAAEAFDQGAHALFLPCGTGHQMGLDVHDMEDLGELWVGYDGEPKSTQFGLKSLRFAKKLKPGHVFTIEPGIYFIPELIDLWKAEKKHPDFLCWNEIEKFRNFGGIRNEEDYLITANSFRLLGNKRKPMSITEVEALR
ncbi:MAG: Xaa-Pro aminopeptidase [Bacteroidales bacterium]|nr:Xaa-Pro aminopeptidase [Bacteroidales bacterium]